MTASVNYQNNQANSVSRSEAGKLADITSVLDFSGVDGTGTTDSSTGLVNASSAANDLWIPPGTYLRASSIAVTAKMRFARGAVFNISTGVTVTFNGQIDAGISQIFNCSGTSLVIINQTYNAVGYPEWWGAQPNVTTYDCSAAINACIVACVITQLQLADYYIRNPVLHQTPHRTVKGFGSDWLAQGTATRIVVTFATGTAYLVGPSTQPTFANYQSENTIQDLMVARSVPPSTVTTAVGFLVQYTLWTRMSNVRSNDHIVHFQIRGTGDSYFDRCYASRYMLPASGTDSCTGFYFDCSVNNGIGSAGGNISVYATQCFAALQTGYTLSSSVGFYLEGADGFSDTFLLQPTTSRYGTGISVVGTGYPGTNNIQNQDLHIINAVLDQVQIAGLSFANIGYSGSVTVVDGYAAPVATSSVVPACITLANSCGITISGFQMLCSNTSTAIGVVGSTCSGLSFIGNVVNECGTNAYELESVSNSTFKDSVRNYYVTTGTTAINLISGCNRNKFDMQIMGEAGAFTVGYDAQGTSNGYNEFNCTGVDPNCLTIAANKLYINGTAVTVTGPAGTNYASGVMN